MKNHRNHFSIFLLLMALLNCVLGAVVDTNVVVNCKEGTKSKGGVYSFPAVDELVSSPLKGASRGVVNGTLMIMVPYSVSVPGLDSSEHIASIIDGGGNRQKKWGYVVSTRDNYDSTGNYVNTTYIFNPAYSISSDSCSHKYEDGSVGTSHNHFFSEDGW